MKTILVPTDFSEIACNAINYAVEIAKLTKAKLILFNVYNVPVVPAEIPIALPIDEIEKDVMKGLKKIEKDICLKHGNELVIECKCV
ncbi:MAG: universal stress protein, partial [Bacteroidetes bacterium]|nr:universal stress protein [Bacteroidota bacterium]